MHASMSNYQCVLFDLDGTLVDSRADLSTSVQLMLVELELKRVESAEIMTFVGEGARLLVERTLERALSGEPPVSLVDHALEVFRKHYEAHLLDSTRPYPGVEQTLSALEGVTLGVVTNKPYDFSASLLEGLGLLYRFAVLIGGDSLEERKPSPLPLKEAARRTGHNPTDCLMVGDTKFDIYAGRDAGMTTCGFTGGFRGRNELQAAGADLLIDQFSELEAIVLRPEGAIGRRASSDI
jgi:phosphoglycolate phosphatase